MVDSGVDAVDITGNSGEEVNDDAGIGGTIGSSSDVTVGQVSSAKGCTRCDVITGTVVSICIDDVTGIGGDGRKSFVIVPVIEMASANFTDVEGLAKPF